MRKRIYYICIAALIAIQLVSAGLLQTQAVSGKIGKLYRYSDNEAKVYWTEVEKGNVLTENITKNYFKIGDDVGYCMDHSFEASMAGVVYDKIIDNLNADDKQRMITLLLNGYPNRVIGDNPLGFQFDSNNHLRMGTQIALWRLMRDIGSPTERGKNFDFNSNNSYYNKSKSNNKVADKIVDYAEALYKKAKSVVSPVWNKMDTQKAINNMEIGSGNITGEVIRKGPYIVRSDDEGARFYLNLYKGSKTSNTPADGNKAVIVNNSYKIITPKDKLRPGDEFYIEILKDTDNSGQEYTVKQIPDEKTKKMNYEIYKCDYKNWQRLITSVKEEISPSFLTVVWNDTPAEYGKFSINKTGFHPGHESAVPLGNAVFNWYIWSEEKGRYLEREGEMEEITDSIVHPEDAPNNVMISGENGYVLSPRIAITEENKGKILVKEIMPPKGYILPEHNAWELQLDKKEIISITIRNTAEYYRLKVQKKDAVSGQLIKGSSTGFKLYDSKKNLIKAIDGSSDDFCTNPETGECFFDKQVFTPGVYYFQETVPPDGYVMPMVCNQCGHHFSVRNVTQCPLCGSHDIDGKWIEFTIGGSKNGSTINIAISNQKENSTVKVIKSIIGENHFPDKFRGQFVFEIYQKEDVEAKGSNLKLRYGVKPLDSFTLNNEGEGFCTEKLGEYFIREIKAPENISYDPDILYYADLRIHDTVYEIHIENSYIPQAAPTIDHVLRDKFKNEKANPETGESINPYMYIIFILSAAASTFAIFVIKRKI